MNSKAPVIQYGRGFFIALFSKSLHSESNIMRKDHHKKETVKITIAEAVASQRQIIDARAPIEFAKGEVPGSINLPLLDDEERHIIGILYKQEGQAPAIEKGYDYLDRKYQQLAQRLQELADEDGRITIMCARGGMRSQIMCSLASSIGLRPEQVEGGYKFYRKWVLDQLDSLQITTPIIIAGQTGVGKTLVLNRLENSLDLEGLAHHRGSLFGGLGLKPASQKNFEGALLDRLRQLNLNEPLFIENESRKVGPCSIPPRLWEIMGKAKVIFLKASLKIRTKRTEEEYVRAQPAYQDRLREMIASMKEHFGKAGVEELIAAFDRGDYHSCFGKILTEYYDPKYLHGFDWGKVIAEIDCNDPDQAATEIQQLEFPHEVA